MKTQEQLTKKTYNILRKWAENEIKEYEKFIKMLDKEYEKTK